jgi:hypothetical protein
MRLCSEAMLAPCASRTIPTALCAPLAAPPLAAALSTHGKVRGGLKGAWRRSYRRPAILIARRRRTAVVETPVVICARRTHAHDHMSGCGAGVRRCGVTEHPRSHRHMRQPPRGDKHAYQPSHRCGDGDLIMGAAYSAAAGRDRRSAAEAAHDRRSGRRSAAAGRDRRTDRHTAAAGRDRRSSAAAGHGRHSGRRRARLPAAVRSGGCCSRCAASCPRAARGHATRGNTTSAARATVARRAPSASAVGGACVAARFFSPRAGRRR